MALKLGNLQSPKKALNPSIQIPNEAFDVCVWRSRAAVTLPSWDFAAGINVYAKEF